jgi:hypothetical protein
MMERRNDPSSAAVHARLRDLIQHFFPLALTTLITSRASGPSTE